MQRDDLMGTRAVRMRTRQGDDLTIGRTVDNEGNASGNSAIEYGLAAGVLAVGVGVGIGIYNLFTANSNNPSNTQSSNNSTNNTSRSSPPRQRPQTP